MSHWRAMTDSEWLRSFDLQGRDVTVTIDKVVAGEVTGENGRVNKRPVLYFRGKGKPLAANATNCKTIARMYGNDTREWVVKRVTLFPATTKAKSGEMVDCLRIRPEIPKTEKAEEKPDAAQ